MLWIVSYLGKKEWDGDSTTTLTELADENSLLTGTMGNHQTANGLEHCAAKRLFYYGFVGTFSNIFKAIEGLLWRISLDPLPACAVFVVFRRADASDKVEERVHKECEAWHLTLIPSDLESETVTCTWATFPSTLILPDISLLFLAHCQ